ncbi:MAG: SDR family oxidoreductase [Myxococcota bacterium]
MRRWPHVVIQGAGRGLGLAWATRLLEEGRTDRLFATARSPADRPGLEVLRDRFGDAVEAIELDLTDPASIQGAAFRVGEQIDRLHLLVNCGGVLHEPGVMEPEKKLEQVDPFALGRAFEVNATGPLLMARWFWPLLRHDERSVLVNLSARVGSIEDNRLGGWYAYRASKAAQNILTRTLAIELGRRAPRCICVALHPGTVDTDLSRPFQRGVPEQRLFSPDFAVERLLGVVDGLDSQDSGGFFAWDGSAIPW